MNYRQILFSFTLVALALTSSASANLEFVASTVYNVSMQSSEEGEYTFTTTGSSPYIYARIDGLYTLGEGDTFLTFEYKSTSGIVNPAVYLVDNDGYLKGTSITTLKPTEEWATCSVDISRQISRAKWGDMLDWLRLCFGYAADCDITIRHLRVCTEGEEWAPTVRDEAADLAYVLSMGLPTLVIETVDRVEPTSERIDHPAGCMGIGLTNAVKVPGQVQILLPDGSVVFDSGAYEKGASGMTVKHRGNTSALYDRKPLKIKLEKKGDMLRRGDKKYNDKNWVLLNDVSGCHSMGMKMNHLMGHPWGPHFEYVNVMLNGRFYGNMLLAEAYERNNDCRITTSKTGFVAELDPYWWNEDGEYLHSPQSPSYNYTFKYPDFEDMTEEQKTYIQGVLTRFEESVAGGTYDRVIDVHSFARWLLGHDILGTYDFAGSNRYFVKEDNTDETLLQMGPMWDFDSIEDDDTVETFALIHNRFPFKSLLSSENPTFLKAYIDMWDQMKDHIFTDIQDYLTGLLEMEDIDNYDRSFLVGSKTQSVYIRTLTRDTNRSLEWYSNRRSVLEPLIEEMREQLSSIITGIVPEIGVEQTADNAIYDLCGRRVENPAPGIYIRSGRKFIVK